MSNIQELADQLGWCITTKDFLNDLNNELQFVANQYDTMTDNLAQSGYMSELLKEVEVMNEEFNQETAKLIGYIESEHLEYIHKQSQSIQGVLERYV